VISRAVLAVILIFLVASATAEHYTMQLGSKSNPNAHLFSYDQKFRESTYLKNYMLNMSASKEFTEATRLSTKMDLRAYPQWTEILINADFIGIGRVGYVVLDPETGDVKEEMSRINHMFIGNFSMEEHIRVVKDYIGESSFLGPV
jgi:hypothetical protein